ncbi:2Fe-2S iron-sulfur cluster-binding protein [Alteribacillus sp. HJP-4]|uniref:2Fe-2S iron-sulfur cluster-binding protein n=1 Tax=Alteribacillus sp. HJP-4 TaxID=2775394 RepID=UPI0035CCEA27
MKKLTIGSLKPGAPPVPQAEKKNSTASISVHKPLQNPVRRQLKMEQNNSRFTVNPVQQQTVLDTALDQKINLDYKCKKGTCGKCQVKVWEGKAMLQPVNNAEEKRLGEKVNENYRLACQAVFN